MGQALSNRIKQNKFESAAQEMVLNLLVAAGHLRASLDRACILHGITIGQYNVLRILRGAHPEGYPRCDIIERMLEPSPDVTRLIDRLQKEGLVMRHQSPTDKRWSIAIITEKGLDQLARMQPAIDAIIADIAKPFSEAEKLQFSNFCERIY